MSNLKTVIAAVALLSIAVAPASAQTRVIRQNRYNTVQRTWQIRSLVDAAERSSNAFRDVVEQRDKNSNTPNRFGTTARERFFNELTPLVQRMDEAFERLRRVADNNRPRAGRDEMVQVLNRARVVDRYFVSSTYGNGTRNRFSYVRSSDLDARWRDLRRDINALARAYNMSGLNARRGW